MSKQLKHQLANGSKSEWPRSLFYSSNWSAAASHVILSRDDTSARRLLQSCQDSFPRPDCVESWVELTLTSALPQKTTKGKMVLTLYPPGKGLIQMRQELRFTILGLLGFVAGIVSFWMGAAMMDLSQPISRLLAVLDDISN